MEIKVKEITKELDRIHENALDKWSFHGGYCVYRDRIGELIERLNDANGRVSE